MASENRVLTTHAGSLPRPADLIELFRRDAPASELAPRLKTAVAEVVRAQRDTGIDIVDDGEYGKETRGPVDYGPWQSYAFGRLEGWEPYDAAAGKSPTSPSGASLKGMGTRRDWQRFRGFYDEYTQTARFSGLSGQPIFSGPIKYRGQQAVAQDIANLKAGVQGSGAAGVFMCAVAPGSFARGRNYYYNTDEEYLFALGEALREEYTAIVEAGFIVQLDDPGLPDSWDMYEPAPSVDEYKRYASLCVEALNHAVRGLPEEQVRYHICWGSWHGPHTTDIPLADVIDLVLKVNAGSYSIEAANVRHEHEWRVWQEMKLPEGKKLIPGVVSHATNLIEHPQLVCDRILRFAGIVGRDNVIAGTDCGLGGRVHEQIAWAKLEALVEGAELATQELWR
jgi:5-methyltetrahydropteroyltriglutamate--homocysteine methyltransferase